MPSPVISSLVAGIKTPLTHFSGNSILKWVRDVLIPATNKEIAGDDITLQEFYVYIWDATSSWHALKESLTGDCGGTQKHYKFEKDTPSGCKSTWTSDGSYQLPLP